MRKSSALAKRGGGMADLKLVKSCMENLAEHRKAISGLNGEIREMLGESENSFKGVVVRALSRIMPKRVQQILPNGMQKFIADETEVLERIETLLRENTNGTQEALLGLISAAKATREEMEELAHDVTQARCESWDARQLQDYIASKSGITIYAEVGELLDEEFGVLTNEEREVRKDELLANLEATLKTGDALMVMMGKACSAGLQVFNVSMAQNYGYLKVYKPMIALRDTANQLMQTNAAMFIAKGALDHTFATALDAIAVSIETAAHVGKFSISSPLTVKMLEDGATAIEAKLANLGKERAENIRRLRSMPFESRSLIEAIQPIDTEATTETTAPAA